MYNLDRIIAEVNSDKTHRSRLAKRIRRENYGVLSYSRRKEGKSTLELTKPAFEYWVRKLKSNKPPDCYGPGQLYCVVLENLRIYRNRLCNIVKVGRCQNFESRKRRYTGPDAIKILIGTRNVTNMQTSEKELIRVFKDNYNSLKNRQEYFLVPVNSEVRLRHLFHLSECPNDRGGASTDASAEGTLGH
jgi:hypothetical protein